MKYIRTRENIFEVVEETDLVYRVRGKRDPESIYSKSKRQTEVLKDSSSLSWLCDNFVFINKMNPNLKYLCWKDDYMDNLYVVEHDGSSKTFDMTEPENKVKTLNEWEIFGAIWTDKGLKYVTKIDENGELKFL